MSVAQNCKLA